MIGAETVQAIAAVLSLGISAGIFIRLGDVMARIKQLEDGSACRKHCKAMQPPAKGLLL